MKSLILFAVLAANAAFGQLTYTGNSNSFGRGTSVSTSIDYFALGTNASNLGWQSKYYKHKFAFKVIDFGTMINTPLSPRTVINSGIEASNGTGALPINGIREVFWSYDKEVHHDTLFTLEDREAIRDILKERSSFKYNRILFGASYSTENYGTFALQVSTEITATIQLSELTANFFTLGRINPYFDSLVLTSGHVIPNRPSAYTNDTLYQIDHAFSNDTLTVGEILNGSYLNGQRTRNYSFGWGKGFPTLFSGWETYLGATINFIEGQEYQNWVTSDNEFSLQGASRTELNRSGVSRSPGMGASIGLSMSIIKQDKFILGASLNNLGFIHWRGRKDNMTMEYSSLYSSNMFDYPFGTSKQQSFNEQWADANLSISTAPGDYYQEGGKFTTATAANLSLGSQWKIHRFVSLSGDVILPLNPRAVGSYQTPYLGFGTAFTFDRIGFATGVNNNFSQLNVPLSITFGGVHSVIDFTVSTYDILNYFLDKKIKNYTLCAGMTLRFK